MTEHYHVRLTAIDKQSFVEIGAYTEFSRAEQAEKKALVNIMSEGGSKYSIRKIDGGTIIHKIEPEGVLDRIDQMLHIVECADDGCLCPHCKGDVLRRGFVNLTCYCPRCDIIL